MGGSREIDSKRATKQEQRLLGPKLIRFEVPVLAACWAIGFAPALLSGRMESTAWIRLTIWGSAHGLGDLRASALFVTIAVTFIASMGAGFRLAAASLLGAGKGKRRAQRAARQVGLAAVCAPLCVLLPPTGALAFLAAVAAVALAGWVVLRPRSVETETLGEAWWNALLRECFPLLSACCFLLLSWEYNAQALLRGLLVAAGLSLMARAALPKR